MSDGSSVALSVDGTDLVDLINKGQGVLNVLSVGGVRSELEADLPDADDLGAEPLARIG